MSSGRGFDLTRGYDAAIAASISATTDAPVFGLLASAFSRDGGRPLRGDVGPEPLAGTALFVGVYGFFG